MCPWFDNIVNIKVIIPENKKWGNKKRFPVSLKGLTSTGQRVWLQGWGGALRKVGQCAFVPKSRPHTCSLNTSAKSGYSSVYTVSAGPVSQPEQHENLHIYFGRWFYVLVPGWLQCHAFIWRFFNMKYCYYYLGVFYGLWFLSLLVSLLYMKVYCFLSEFCFVVYLDLNL